LQPLSRENRENSQTPQNSEPPAKSQAAM
jgi:hypothetical protein